MTTAQSVVDILTKEGGYRELEQPVKVGSVWFQFAHMLVAEKSANDLVVVIELKNDAPDEIFVRNILGLTRALDVLRSRRSVTAVLTSGQAEPETIRSISRVCRVLPIGAPIGPKATDAVRDWLSVLLPLERPTSVAEIVDWENELRAILAKKPANELVENLIKSASKGPKVVEGLFAAKIRDLCQTALTEDGE